MKKTNETKQKNNEQKGFTIIELMISTTIFSLILMLCLAGIMQITKMYYRGITQNRTREVARTITDEISEAVRYSNQPIQVGLTVAGPRIEPDENTIGYFCVGPRRYTYSIDRQVKSNPSTDKTQKQVKHALWVDQLGGCLAPAKIDLETPTPDGKDLIPENMRLYDLSLTQIDAAKNLYEVSVAVAYGDEDLLHVKKDAADVPTDLTCEGGFVGVEFCATTKFLVTIQKRL